MTVSYLTLDKHAIPMNTILTIEEYQNEPHAVQKCINLLVELRAYILIAIPALIDLIECVGLIDDMSNTDMYTVIIDKVSIHWSIFCQSIPDLHQIKVQIETIIEDSCAIQDLHVCIANSLNLVFRSAGPVTDLIEELLHYNLDDDASSSFDMIIGILERLHSQFMILHVSANELTTNLNACPYDEDFSYKYGLDLEPVLPGQLNA
jgi:hypothetical protein